MQQETIEAVVMPVQNTLTHPYLDTLTVRRDTLTCLIHGWKGEESGRMLAPSDLLRRKQWPVPFLFRETGQDAGRRAATHIGVCGLVVHLDDCVSPGFREWLVSKRVERFAHGEEKIRGDARSSYVVTALEPLERPIPLGDLCHPDNGRRLSPKKEAGILHGQPARAPDGVVVDIRGAVGGGGGRVTRGSLREDGGVGCGQILKPRDHR